MSRPTGSKNKLLPTRATSKFFRYFLRPFVEMYRYAEGEEQIVKGYKAFFNTHCRRLCYCKAKRSFTMPGLLWETVSHPFKLIQGTGRRYVKSGESFVLRIDANTSDVCEIEFDEQVFVLSEPEYETIKDYVSLEA